VRFVPPSTFEAPGSDLHRVCLTRLCDAFRLSQPPGVFFLPEPYRLCFASVTPLGFSLQRFVPLACRRHLSVRLPLLTSVAKDPPSRPSHHGIRSPGTDLRQRPTRHRVNMPAPTCVLARDVPGPSIAPVLWMGPKTRRALQRHSARRSSQQSFRLIHRPTGASSGCPVETPRFGGHREVSPSCILRRRGADRGPRASSRRPHAASRASRRPVSANGHRSFRSNRLASAWSGSGRGGVVLSCHSRAVRYRVLPKSSCTLPRNRARKSAATLPRPAGERLGNPRSEPEACWSSLHSPRADPFRTGPETGHPQAHAARLQTRLQGFEPRESPCYQPPGVTRMVGADPLLGFQLPRVFSLPGAAVPLHGLLSRTCDARALESDRRRVPQSLGDQEGWLASLECCRPFRVFRPRSRHVPRAEARGRVPFVRPGQFPKAVPGIRDLASAGTEPSATCRRPAAPPKVCRRLSTRVPRTGTNDHATGIPARMFGHVPCLPAPADPVFHGPPRRERHAPEGTRHLLRKRCCGPPDLPATGLPRYGSGTCRRKSLRTTTRHPKVDCVHAENKTTTRDDD
jgi:hypothetical protein